MNGLNWWLRSPGNNSNNAANVNNDGSVNTNGNNVNNTNKCVRPASCYIARSLPKVREPVLSTKESNSFLTLSGEYLLMMNPTLGLGGLWPRSKTPWPHQLESIKLYMEYYDAICDFQNLYKAHLLSRRSKQDKKEVIDFEINLAYNLARLSNELKTGKYQLGPYYEFEVHDPKKRIIHAMHYRDRVVQHAICDEALVHILDKRLIYDNAACRMGKGTHFALRRFTQFLTEFYKQYGNNGYVLKCDIRKYFDNINHDILKQKLKKVVMDKRLLALLYNIIDSYETASRRGLPLGNQTSQWFAIYYLDSLDRLIKEKLRIRYYSRYMDDCVLLNPDKQQLKVVLDIMRGYIENELRLTFNEKTQIISLKQGVNYLGWRFYLSSTGKVVRRVSQVTKVRCKRKLKRLQCKYAQGYLDIRKVHEVVNSYHAHLSHGHSYRLEKNILDDFVLSKNHI